MKSNTKLQADVQNALRWEPLLHEVEIGVTAKAGIWHVKNELAVDYYYTLALVD